MLSHAMPDQQERLIYGRHFTIESDHKPLSFLFDEKRSIPQMASARIQRWALSFSAHRYSVTNRGSTYATLTHSAGCPGQLPLHTNVLIDHLSATSIGPANIRECTSKDPVLSTVHRFVMSSWPDQKLGEKFTPYTIRKAELSVLNGCILWASRVVVPPPGRQLVLDELHDTIQASAR